MNNLAIDVQHFPIGDSRCLFVLRPNRDVVGMRGPQLAEIGKRVSEQLSRWWDSGDKFGVVIVDTSITFEVERVDGQG